MSPPIYTPDGSEVTEVVLPDGSTASEVVAPDGSVVFDAGPDIPDSVEYQVRVGEFADPWPFNIGSTQMGVTGFTASTFTNGADSVFGDGPNGDGGLASGPETLPQNESFTVAFTTEFVGPGAGVNQMFASSRDGTTDFFVRHSVEGVDGSIELSLDDNNDNQLQVHTDNGYAGNEHAIIITKSGNTASDINFYVDDMTTPVPTTNYKDSGFDHSNYTNSADMAFWQFGDNGTLGGLGIEADIGIFEFASEAYSQSQRENFVSRRPEV